MLVLCVAGARPNFMKVKPVVDALEDRGATTFLLHTGQHYDPAMSDIFFADLGMRSPDAYLGVGSGSHAVQTGAVMTAFEEVLRRVRPDVVVVVGDVNSTLACALVAAKEGPLLAHIEAGLRSRDWTMPEEVNRVVTDRVSDFLFAPSADAVTNLRNEGYRPDQIHLVGNVMIDTLLANIDRARNRRTAESLGIGERYALVTLHRPANVDDPNVLRQIVGALSELARQLPVVFPVHPRARSHIEAAGCHDVRVMDPLGYLDFLSLEQGASIVLTDSGGVQEETTALGVPCLTLRENTERPITVSEGTNTVVGRDRERILAAARKVLTEGVPLRRPDLWDGKAALRIAAVLLERADAMKHPRPTSQGSVVSDIAS